jgi:3-phenylpropionate/trans-cinnamate dioxygenase ferredoxin reductase subunit
VLVAVGAAPADKLAIDAGLFCDGGIVVDENCRSSDPHIFAAGDCANQVNERYGQRLRLESVDNAFEQGTCAALSILGMAHSAERVPWFWSDQYDVKLVIVGVSQGYDQLIVRGDPETRSFSVCYLREGELIALDTINSPKEQMAGRKLVGARASPRLERLTDSSVPLRECV